MKICKYLFTFKDTRMQFGLIGIKRCIYLDSRCIHIASNCNSLKTKMTCIQSNSWNSYFTGVHIHLNTVIVFRDCNEFDYCLNTGNTNSFLTIWNGKNCKYQVFWINLWMLCFCLMTRSCTFVYSCRYSKINFIVLSWVFEHS